MFDFAEVTNEEVARLRRRYEPLTDSVRQLIDAALRSEVGDDDVASAMMKIDAATALLRSRQRDGPLGMGLTPDGETVAWGNVAIGPRNPIAPPLVVIHDSPGSAHLDTQLGAAYEGAPGHLRGGYSALVLDHLPVPGTPSRNATAFDQTPERTAAHIGVVKGGAGRG